MKEKENQRIALTKRLLKENLLKLMETKNIHSISVIELCGAAGINRSTFYNHYGKPYDVLTDIERDVIRDVDEIWHKTVTQKCPFNQRVEILCQYMSEHSYLSKLLLRDEKINAEFINLLFDTANIRLLYGSLLSDIKDGGGERLAMTFLVTGAYQMIRQWLLEDIPKSPKEMGELASQVMELTGKIPFET